MRGAVAPLIIEDASRDERFAQHPGLKALGVHRYIAVPLIRRDGRAFGTLCALDPDPGRLPESLLRQFGLTSELIALQLDEQAQSSERERFMGILAHDLRNPLHSIQLSTTLLEDASPSEHVELVARIHSSVERMRNLIEDLTDMTRGRIGQELVLDRTKCEVEPLLRALVAEFFPADRLAANRIAVDVRGNLGIANWDRKRISQAFSNVLGNAHDHSPAHSSVRVSAIASDEAIDFEFQNAGTPIPREMLENLFQPFQAAATSAGAKHLGLGLYITERIVAAHGGRIAVRSNENEGTLFEVHLPRT